MALLFGVGSFIFCTEGPGCIVGMLHRISQDMIRQVVLKVQSGPDSESRTPFWQHAIDQHRLMSTRLFALWDAARLVIATRLIFNSAMAMFCFCGSLHAIASTKFQFAVVEILACARFAWAFLKQLIAMSDVTQLCQSRYTEDESIVASSLEWCGVHHMMTECQLKFGGYVDWEAERRDHERFLRYLERSPIGATFFKIVIDRDLVGRALLSSATGLVSVTSYLLVSLGVSAASLQKAVEDSSESIQSIAKNMTTAFNELGR